jgi:hypothetical protein
MTIQAHISIDASKEKVWSIISNIEDSVNSIQAIEKITVLNKPDDGFIGFKWKETRTMFGKEATEVMWITEAAENEFYRTRAESHGAVYISELSISKENGASNLTMKFSAEPQTLAAKVMWATTGFIFKNVTKKALLQDLMDIKAVAEN